MATAALQYGATRSNVYLHFSEVTAESTVVYSFSERMMEAARCKRIKKRMRKGLPSISYSWTML